MDADLREKSLMYTTGCRIGSLVGSSCFKTRKVSASFGRDKTSDKRLSVHFKDIKVFILIIFIIICIVLPSLSGR